ncbi:MAG: FAD-dependent oxidoreductase [Candidatus Dormibacteraceae bacterium]
MATRRIPSRVSAPRRRSWSGSVALLLAEIDSKYLDRAIWALPAPLTWEPTSGATLLGDAAHVMAPFGGYGVNLALLDGAELARAVAKEPTINGAIARYERTMLPRSGKLATSANQALAEFFDQPFVAETTADHEAEHRAYEAAAVEHRRQQEATASEAFRE